MPATHVLFMTALLAVPQDYYEARASTVLVGFSSFSDHLADDPANFLFISASTSSATCRCSFRFL